MYKYTLLLIIAENNLSSLSYILLHFDWAVLQLDKAVSMKKYLKYLKIAGLLIVTGVIITIPVNAQISSSGIAIPISTDEVFENGTILCSDAEGIIACENEYDQSMHGVLVTDPPVALESVGDEGEALSLYLPSGTAHVRVSGRNGAISEGGLITSSTTPGVGMSADKNGYVLGTALENYNADNPEDEGLILVSISIHPAAGLTGARSDLLQALRQGVRAPLFDPLDSLRYFLAALIVLVGFTLGFVYFGRVGRTGVEAIGRNPLASRMIQISVLIHVVVTIVIILVGLFIAYLILIL